jgi:homopolymeric O-antigen transport system permease protein
MLGWMEIKQRYRRSVIGPFWITISTGALIAGIGPLYARLMGQEPASYFPYFAISFVLWQFMATMINDCCNAFITADAYIKQVKIPLTVHVLRVVWRNFIIFFHNLLIVGIVLALYPPPFHWTLLLAALGWLLAAINGVWIGLVLGLLSARFRDIPQVVASLLQVAFFLTPVMWTRSMLGRHAWAADFNPFYYFLEIGRAPLLGHPPTAIVWVAVLAITVCGYAVALLLFSRFRARIAYWM